MALTTANFVGVNPRRTLGEMNLPTKRQIEKMEMSSNLDQEVPLFWQCNKCGASVLFAVEDCYNCIK